MSDYIQRPKGFKKLVEDISMMYTEEERERIFWDIDRSLDRGNITMNEYNILYDIAKRIQTP